MKKLLILLTVIGVFALGVFIFYHEGSLPVNKVSKESQIFIINPGEGLNSIARRLSTEELIRSRIVFYLTVKQLGIEKQIQAGDFRLSKSMSASQLAEELTHGTLDEWVQIIEGLRKEEIAEVVTKKFNFTETEFNALAKEGYLFPDTYLIPKQATASFIVDYLTNTFDSKYTAEFQKKAQKLKLTKDQVVTLASIVEREARSKEAKNQVASILLHRLDEKMPLQVDATIQYALGYQQDENSWWKRHLTLADLKLDSPYNTYVNEGLPPGPICSPGIDAIEAVVNGDPSTPYLFYITGNDNKMHYAKTGDEHQKNVEKYLR
ncbi:MAG: endolytic transglycosylase MltG [Patescibacteria group bacterium]